jgi:hypothetical protein
MNMSVSWSRTTSVVLSSNARRTREARDTTRIAAMKKPPILTPSGRSRTLATVVYTKIAVITAKAAATLRWPARRAASATATPAEVNSTSTPVA